MKQQSQTNLYLYIIIRVGIICYLSTTQSMFDKLVNKMEYTKERIGT